MSKGSLILIPLAPPEARPDMMLGGNVGIGSTAPGYKLDVAGDFGPPPEPNWRRHRVMSESAPPPGRPPERPGGGDRQSAGGAERNRGSGDSDGVGVGSPRFTVGRADITVNGQKDIVTSGMTNVNDVFVYDTTKDMDGGRWRMDDRAKASSWYNEALDDGASDPCVNDTDDRCGRREFPEKAVIVATNTDLYIFDAKDNSQWMNFDKGATTTEQMIGPTTNSTGVTVTAYEGKIYYGNQGSAGGLYVIDFVRDQGYRYNSTDDYVGDRTVSNRNSTVTWTTGPGQPIVNSSVNDVSANVICSSNINVSGGACKLTSPWPQTPEFRSSTKPIKE